MQSRLQTSKSAMELQLKMVEDQMQRFQHARKTRHEKQATGTDITFRSDTHRACYHILRNPIFDFVFGMLILVNLILVICETNAVAKDEDPALWVEILSWTILLCFIGELSLRLYVLQWEFFLDGVNVFDFVLVVGDSSLNLVATFASKVFPVSFLRIVRLLKLARVAKAFHVFPELRLMMAGLLGSVKAIFWGTVLLVFALLIWAIVAVQFIHPLNREMGDYAAYEGCERCSRAYASVWDAALTFSQQIVAGDSWGQITIPVIEEHPATAIFYAAVFSSIGMAVLNLILGVVVDVASQARDCLKSEMDNEKLMERLEHQSHLMGICQDIDADGDGEVNREELFSGYNSNQNLREALSNMDVQREDLEVLWTILDMDKTGTISYGEFVSNCYRLKSSDTHFVLAYVKYYITVIKDKICAQLEETKVELLAEEKKIEAEEQKMMAEMLAEEQKIGNVEHMMEEGEADRRKGDAILSYEINHMTGLDTALQSVNTSTFNMPDGALTAENVNAFVARLASEVQILLDSVSKFNKPMADALDKRKEQDDDKIDKLGAKIDLVSWLDKGAPEDQKYVDILQSTQRLHIELMASMDEMKQKLDISSPLNGSAVVASPPLRKHGDVLPWHKSAAGWTIYPDRRDDKTAYPQESDLNSALRESFVASACCRGPTIKVMPIPSQSPS